MYPHGKYGQARSESACRQQLALPLGTHHTLLWLWFVLLCCASLLSTQARAETNISLSSAGYTDNTSIGKSEGYNQIETPFYAQLQRSNAYGATYRNDGESFLLQVMGSNYQDTLAPSTVAEDDELAFHYLWMQQYQENYHHRDGGAAAGKILRMGVKALYKSYVNGVIYSAQSNEDIEATISDLEYRLRVSGDKVKLGIEYEF